MEALRNEFFSSGKNVKSCEHYLTTRESLDGSHSYCEDA